MQLRKIKCVQSFSNPIKNYMLLLLMSASPGRGIQGRESSEEREGGKEVSHLNQSRVVGCTEELKRCRTEWQGPVHWRQEAESARLSCACSPSATARRS